MASFDQVALAEIKDRIVLSELIGEYGIDIKRAGSAVKACCPFHNEKTPSFHINNDKGFYKCFGCGEHGDIFTFVQKYEGIPFIEAVRKLAERAGVKLEERYDPQAQIRNRLYQINQELAAFYRRCLLQTREGQIARDYLASRALSDEVAEQFQIGYAPLGQDTLLKWADKHGFTAEELVAAGLLAPPRRPGDRYYDRFHGRLTFPICDTQGRVIAFSCRLLREAKNTGKYVNSPETEIFKKSTTLYALHLARGHIAKATPRRALVCEGQVDVIRCHACGFNTAIASQGTAFTAEHVGLLKRYADTADLVFDGDKAGIKAALRTMELFLAEGIPVRIVSLPADEDPDSLLQKQGNDAFQSCLNAAEDPAVFLVRSLKAMETAPDTMEATVRIARTVVMTVLNCPTPVLTTRFLQDAAQALNLPVSTLLEDLEDVRANAAEAERRRAEFLARQEEHGNRTTQKAPVSPEIVSDGTFVDDEMLLPDEESEFIPDDSYETFEQDSEPEAPPLPTADDLDVSQNLAGALCELLAHYFTDQEVMACLLQHLPPAFIRNPYAAKLYDLAIQATLSKHQHLTPDHSDTAFSAYLAKLFAAADRISSGSDDISPLSYARDIVRHYWLREFEHRTKLLEPMSMEAFQLTLHRKRLQSLTWEEAAPFMNALDPNFALPQGTTKTSANASPTTPLTASSTPSNEAPAEAVQTDDASTETPPTDDVDAIEWLPDEDEVNIYEML